MSPYVLDLEVQRFVPTGSGLEVVARWLGARGADCRVTLHSPDLRA